MKLPDVKAFWDEVAAIPQIARGQVWCHACGRTERVNGGEAMRHGWPKCCGFTMSIDSHEERAARPTPTDVTASAAIILGGGSDSPCNTPDEPTEPGC